ncbi:helix-turn-helix domain-containing protein [Pseudoruegeria sp. SK021]|uniref:helix-turn-helix domain-containing protein n=1 Tax=Pseudoruegeria sp. SK021 TaxID=1933035 RepID=UPI000A24E0C4|nr:helix-turn-helix domain-containing protein [Pseudoruegeria sp. SK021]OSP56243.1 hypothetical protein BV911_02820 [Pseudoruegeria sp. SK021]
MNGRIDQPAETRDVRPKSFDDFELTLGDIMRGERATKGKSLLEVQRDIKIKAEYLAAIEDADLSFFETPGFIAGYVKSYARYLGMNPEWAYRTFCAESGFSHVAGLDAQVYAKKTTRRAAPVKAHSDVGDAMLARSPIYVAQAPGAFSNIRVGAIGSMMVLVALIGGLGYGGWSILQQIQKVTLTPVETGLATASRSDPLELGGLVAENAAPTTAALERLYRPQALDAPIMVPRDGPIAVLDPGAQGVFAQYVPPQTPDAAPQQPETPIAEPEIQVVEATPPKVVLFARRPAWVRVKAADGTVLLEKILEQGERFILPDTDQAPTLRAGNSGSVFFAVNGETLGPAGPGTSVAKNVVLSAAALSDAYQVADLAQDTELARLAELVIEPIDLPAPE